MAGGRNCRSGRRVWRPQGGIVRERRNPNIEDRQAATGCKLASNRYSTQGGRLMMRRVFCSSFSCLVLLAAADLPAFAQKDAGAIVGGVLDSSGASGPGAKVSAVNIGTNYAYTATTDTAGQYTISPVQVGTYKVSVSVQGFKTAVVEAITIEVQQRARVDFNLQPGEVKETIEVTERAPLLEADTSERGQ